MLNYFEQTPDIYEENNQALVACGDVLTLLGRMCTGSVDLIFADPPYNIGKDFGVGSQSMTDQDYIEWCKKWIDECMRVLNSTGTFYFMAATQYFSELDVFVSKKYSVLSRIIWVYDSSGVQPKKKFGSLYEPILMVVKDPDNYTFNTDDIAIEAKTGAKRKLMDYRKTPPKPYNTKKVPGNVWEFPRVRFKMPEYENHPSQKPESLLTRIILGSSNAGDVVLDPFGGSFTTGAVAIQNHRRAISFDLNHDYFKIGLRRLGICSEYEGKYLERDLSRKTQNKSKQDHNPQQKLPGFG